MVFVRFINKFRNRKRHSDFIYQSSIPIETDMEDAEIQDLLQAGNQTGAEERSFSKSYNVGTAS